VNDNPGLRVVQPTLANGAITANCSASLQDYGKKSIEKFFEAPARCLDFEV